MRVVLFYFYLYVAVAVAAVGCSGDPAESADPADSSPESAASSESGSDVAAEQDTLVDEIDVGPEDGGSGPGSFEPLLSYTPTCDATPGSDCSDQPCLGGTEVQALETHGGVLFAGLTNWMETNTCVWPATSAQVLYLETEGGPWKAAPALPDPPTPCTDDAAAWEQINDLASVEVTSEQGNSSVLFVATFPNEDLCPGLSGSVFALDEAAGAWEETGLGARLQAFYGERGSEVRYVSPHTDGSADCPADRPCLFAFVGPRSPGVPFLGPTVWRGTIEPDNPGCSMVCWDEQPEFAFDGVSGAMATRILSAHSMGPTGLFVGTSSSLDGGDFAIPQAVADACDADPAGHACLHTVVMRRSGPGEWAPVWHGPRFDEHADDQVRGLTGWVYPDGRLSIWFVTHREGNVYRLDAEGDTAELAVLETQLPGLVGEGCQGFYGFQIYLHRRSDDDPNPALVVASDVCFKGTQGGPAHLFYRFVDACPQWQPLELPNVTDDPATGPREDRIRWVERSPFDAKDLFFGTTDMVIKPGSLTARIYRMDDVFEGACDP